MKNLAGVWMLLALSSVAAGFAGTRAHAQETKERRALEEVIVTAQRRSEDQQDVAISITVLTQDDIANANMTNTSDLAALTPSLSADERFGPDRASFSIRGFTKVLRTTASVGVYFAEVISPRGQSISPTGDGGGPGTLFDLQNVQVLKGAQGTLFGRNTTGGAILLVPHEPSEEFEGTVQLSYGSFGLTQQEAVINVPVTDNFRLRFGFDSKDQDGYLDNITNVGADKLADVGYNAGRISATWDVTDTLENYTVVNYVDSETKGQTSTIFLCNDISNGPTANPILLFTQQGCQSQLERQRSTGQDGFYDVVSTVPTPSSNIEDLRFINRATWQLSDNISIKNILSYMHLETQGSSDGFGTQFTETQAALLGMGLPGGIADPKREYIPAVSLRSPDVPLTSQETWVAELQIQGDLLDGRMQWQSGVYYENSLPDGSSGNTSPILISCDLSTLESPNPADFNCNDISGGALGGVARSRLETEYTNKAVYAQSSLDISDAFTITAGARYTVDETEGDIEFTLYKFAGTLQQQPILTRESESKKSKAPTGLLELQYRPHPNVMTYMKYVRGYRQGSVNMAADAGVQTFDKEIVDTYEIGVKADWETFIPGRLNIAIFDNDFKDMQLQTGYISPNKGPTTAIFNAGAAEIRGVEADAAFEIYDGLVLSLGYSKLDTELLEQGENCAKVQEVAGPTAGFTCNSTTDVGSTLPFAPDEAYTVSLNYQLPLPPDWGRVSLGATHIYTGETRILPSTVAPYDVIDSYRLLNANLGWESILNTPVDFSFFVTNLRDEEYVTNISGSLESFGFVSRSTGRPRMYGARISYRF